MTYGRAGSSPAFGTIFAGVVVDPTSITVFPISHLNIHANKNTIPRNIGSLIKRALIILFFCSLSFIISPSFFSKLAFKYGVGNCNY